MSHLRTIGLGRPIQLNHPFDAGVVELALQVPRGVCELGEHEDLLTGEVLGLEQMDQSKEFVVVLRLELLGFAEKLYDLLEVQEGLSNHLLDLVLVAIKLWDSLKHLCRHDVLVLCFGFVIVPVPEDRAGGCAV